MSGSKRILPIFLLAAFTLSAAAFADGATPTARAARTNEGVAAAQAKPASLRSLERSIFGGPQDRLTTKTSCTSNASCSPVGGTPVSCTGASCTGTSVWVLCDGNYTFCTCNPNNIPTCTDPVGFCECWTAAPVNGWGVCRQAHCL